MRLLRWTPQVGSSPSRISDSSGGVIPVTNKPMGNLVSRDRCATGADDANDRCLPCQVKNDLDAIRPDVG